MMNNNLTSFAQFGRASRSSQAKSADGKSAVIYTRVSSKEQADKNLSLKTQRKTIEDYAERNGFAIAACFGGTYESAKTDGRKEFQRMLEFIRKNKDTVTHILVYTLDRFSRTGGGAIKLAEELREKYGITVFAVTQPADTSNPSGVLQQSIHFIFSQYDNQLRKQRVVAGMKEKYERGIWVTKVPMGYDIVKSGGERRITVNETGKKLAKAFTWKAKGMKNEEILTRLRAMGVRIYKQKLSSLLRNPFYCGLIAHELLDGKVVEGKHEKLISQELFLKVNEINSEAKGCGVPHAKERDEVPLKVFIRCSACDAPFTGYVVKAKNLWYYKCRTKGCRCNKSARQMHDLFTDLLSEYTLQPELAEPMQEKMEAMWQEMNKDAFEQNAALKASLSAMEKKIEGLEERYHVEREMNRETFDKFHTKLTAERAEIQRQLTKIGTSISNPQETIRRAVGLSLKLAPSWASSDVSNKEHLQKLVFPEGIIYDRENEAFRTGRVNTFFACMAGVARVPAKNEKGQTGTKTRLSNLVVAPGFEPRQTEPKSVVLPLHHATILNPLPTRPKAECKSKAATINKQDLRRKNIRRQPSNTIRAFFNDP